jgi:hypothetical protein
VVYWGGAQPGAESVRVEGAQSEEEDMGKAYADLNDLGQCRKVR